MLDKMLLIFTTGYYHDSVFPRDHHQDQKVEAEDEALMKH